MGLRRREISDRLRRPPNAKPDHGIVMHNGRPVPYEPPPPPPAPPPSDLVDLDLHRLVRTAEHIESLFALGGAAAWLALPATGDGRPPQIRLIQNIVARYYGVAVADMLGANRTMPLVWPRHVAMYLAHRFTRRSLPDIGRVFGKRDHTTVMHALRKVSALRREHERTRDEIHLLIMRICEVAGCSPFEEAPGDG